ncbi:helix-turn-helix domain-containing protein [Paraburkholderia sp. EG287A]|uniref:helix-turn-helix domain-containing protein n=1 Tax=unclassified Paraburkholderia TaxID=2615204 RepID=UPI0034D2DD0C
MENTHLHELPVLERVLVDLNIGVANFSRCDIRDDGCTRFDARTTASLHYCIAGRGVLVTHQGVRVSLSSDSFVLLSAGVSYTIESDGPTAEGGGIATAWGEASLDTAAGGEPFGALRQPLVAQFEEKSGLRDQFVLLLAECAQPRLGSRALIEALFKQCLIMALRRQIDAGSIDLPWAVGIADKRLASALQAILERPASSLSVERLAAIAGMSRSAFAAQFMKAFGQSPMAMLKIVRLKKAAKLLATTTLPVAEVAKKVGFSSRSNFSLAFNSMHGLDPTTFRRRQTSGGGQLKRNVSAHDRMASSPGSCN